MHENAGLEFAYDKRIQIALALRSPPRQQHHVRIHERFVQCLPKRIYVISKRTPKDRLAAKLMNRVSQNSPVTVEDKTWTHLLAGLNDLIPGRKDRDSWPPHNRNVLTPNRGKNASFPRAKSRPRE